jgi:hypothetical protein
MTIYVRHALIRLGVSPPSFVTGAQYEVLRGPCHKPLITEEIWPGQRLNPGLPNITPVPYPLLHELMLKCFKYLDLFPGRRRAIQDQSSLGQRRRKGLPGRLYILSRLWFKVTRQQCDQGPTL